MQLTIKAGCAAGFGQGGLGGHLEFVHRAACTDEKIMEVYCRNAPRRTGFIDVPNPLWSPWVKYTPARWLPSWQVYRAGCQFDQEVAELLADHPSVYHCFPGFAEKTFRKIRKKGGITVLEAATTHVEDLYAVTEEEHRRLNMAGSPFSRPWVERVMREYELADYITVASSLQFETFLDRGIPKGKLLYAPLGIDSARFTRNWIGNRHPDENETKFRIIQVGQISLRKGFQYLLEAVEMIGDPDIEVILFGGIGWRTIRNFIEDYRKRGLHIRQEAGDPVPALSEADICVHPSIEDGFGLAPLEAMSMGLPTIVTNATGMKDVIEDGVNGIIIPSKDPGMLAHYIKELKSDEFFRKKMGEAARETALRYDISRSSANYAQVLKPVWNAL